MHGVSNKIYKFSINTIGFQFENDRVMPNFIKSLWNMEQYTSDIDNWIIVKRRIDIVNNR